MMMTGAPIKLTQADAADVADLYNRCSDYFLLQDGAAPTLDDAREGSVANSDTVSKIGLMYCQGQLR